MWILYILRCADDSLYTGITNNLARRVQMHQNRKGGAYTRTHPPLGVIYTEPCKTKSEALRREWEIKSWSRAEKIARLDLTL
jgi:putative endonuclease